MGGDTWNDGPNKGLKFKIYKEFIHLNTKTKQNNKKEAIQLKHGQRTWRNIFSKDIQMASRDKDAQHH